MVLRLFTATCASLLVLTGSPNAQEVQQPDTTQPVNMDRAQCEQLGLSLTECKQIYLAKMPIKRVHELMEAGISIHEYFTEPWKKLGITEKKWLKHRRAGLSVEDLESMYIKKRKSSPADSTTDSTKTGQ